MSIMPYAVHACPYYLTIYIIIPVARALAVVDNIKLNLDPFPDSIILSYSKK